MQSPLVFENSLGSNNQDSIKFKNNSNLGLSVELETVSHFEANEISACLTLFDKILSTFLLEEDGLLLG